LVDDSHATGFIGNDGRGTPQQCGVEGRIDILTSTLGKALGVIMRNFVNMAYNFFGTKRLHKKWQGPKT
jgi:hypothetical protein